LIKIEDSSYKTLIDVLDIVPFNTFFVRSVLEGHAEGQVYVDKETNPASFYVRHVYGMSFLYGDTSNHAFNNDLIHYFDTIKQDEWLQAYPRDWNKIIERLTESMEIEISTRLNFVFDQLLFEKNTSQFDIDNYTIQEGTIDIKKGFRGSVVPTYYWKEHLLPICKSYAAFSNGEPVALAFNAFLHGKNFEIGIETLEEHRGMGYAMAVCISLIRYCIHEGLTPVWACRLENTGSVNLAKRLGFIESIRLPYYILSAKSVGAYLG
jgi:GNAT superfamily N-acetyltransferase